MYAKWQKRLLIITTNTFPYYTSMDIIMCTAVHTFKTNKKTIYKSHLLIFMSLALTIVSGIEIHTFNDTNMKRSITITSYYFVLVYRL